MTSNSGPNATSSMPAASGRILGRNSPMPSTSDPTMLRSIAGTAIRLKVSSRNGVQYTSTCSGSWPLDYPM